MNTDVKAVAEALAAPFEASEVKWKAQAVSGARALAVAYVDARVVQDRLDEVLGVMGWQDRYDRLPDGAVVCSLRVRVGAEWVEKVDVGGQSEQPDEGDRAKAAFSDALKRAAVKFGVGRYLYRLPAVWVDYDPKKKQLLSVPPLPPGARPRPPGARPRPPAKAASGELARRLRTFEDALVEKGLCEVDDLLRHVTQTLGKYFAGAIDGWPDNAIDEVATACKAFEADCRSRLPPTEEQFAALEKELQRTGEDWKRVLRKLKLAATTTASQLTQAQAQAALAALGEMPDAPTQKK